MKRWVFTCVVVWALAGCEGAIQDMYNQPRAKPLRSSREFPQKAPQPLPEGSVVRAEGALAMTSSGRIDELQAENDRAEKAQSMPDGITLERLSRGRERYAIYCAPCHSPLGDGEGRVVERGFPHPPSYHTDDIRRLSDRQIYDVITNGYGIMYSYADRVAPVDRWSIVAYIRALQLSQHAEVSKLPADVRRQLEGRSSEVRR